MKDLEQFISDEMLAAYIDGNAIPIEKNIIEANIGNDELQEFMDIVSDVQSNLELFDTGEYLKKESPDQILEETGDILKELKLGIDREDKYIM